MKRTILLGTLATALLAPFAASQAHSNVSIGVSTPEFGIRIGGPAYYPGQVYAPAPVFVPTPVVVPVPVYAPRPVHAVPGVFLPAPVIVAPPRYAPRHFGPRAGVWVAPRAYHHHRGWDDRRHWRRGDGDSDGYRAGHRY
jgi:hypothetical protein